jgi:hypothetical protein
MTRRIILTLTIGLLVEACKFNAFDKTGFAVGGDLGSYPNRDRMLYDLIKNHKLKGLTYKQLIKNGSRK